MTSSVLDKKKTQKCYILTEEKVDNPGSRMGISLKKSLCKFTLQNGMTKFLTQGILNYANIKLEECNNSFS
jgi:uncharacterized membrane protein